MANRVSVIGGGPAGLIAAETVAAAGHSVVVFEHRRSVGRKFLLAGRSGLNLSHDEPLDELLSRYGAAQPKLESAIRAFPPEALRAWCHALGQDTFVGSSGRVFPDAFRATPLLRSWLSRLDDLGVEVRTRQRWVGWAGPDASRFVPAGAGSTDVDAAAPPDGDPSIIERFDATVLALGGASWPRVGSDGQWTKPMRQGGVEVTPLEAANCGVHVDWTDLLRERFAGHPIKNTVFTVGASQRRGDAVVTETGLEGGPIYALGPEIRDQLAAGVAQLLLNPFPDLSQSVLAGRLAKRRPKASATSWLRSAGVPDVVVGLARDATGNALPSDADLMAALLQCIPLDITDVAGLERAISSAGGVALAEIDDSFMLLERPGTFVAGEMLDWEAPTGGYLLQACFSTGVAAGQGVLDWLDRQARS